MEVLTWRPSSLPDFILGFGSRMDYSDDAEEHFRRRPRKMAYLGDPSRRQFESLSGRSYAPGEMGYMQEEDISLDAIRARWTNVLKRHSELAERLSRDADKIIYERLQKEFEAARAIQTQETYLDGEQWNDGLLATIRERVHMEAERKAMEGDVNMLPGQEKITYKIGNKVILRSLFQSVTERIVPMPAKKPFWS
ncbi:hypothetical protein C1H46_027626 [Malus baccata]|uniref:Uncharacterized protein n=1 Tax=Malus baccata TaxID=106549 RepID=A0A540LJW4_MALBA|nr:hypothetical protein C1H46_027626 [Malus baccata]